MLVCQFTVVLTGNVCEKIKTQRNVCVNPIPVTETCLAMFNRMAYSGRYFSLRHITSLVDKHYAVNISLPNSYNQTAFFTFLFDILKTCFQISEKKWVGKPES